MMAERQTLLWWRKEIERCRSSRTGWAVDITDDEYDDVSNILMYWYQPVQMPGSPHLPEME